jgi:hypothetical protein
LKKHHFNTSKSFKRRREDGEEYENFMKKGKFVYPLFIPLSLDETFIHDGKMENFLT